MRFSPYAQSVDANDRTDSFDLHSRRKSFGCVSFELRVIKSTSQRQGWIDCRQLSAAELIQALAIQA